MIVRHFCRAVLVANEVRHVVITAAHIIVRNIKGASSVHRFIAMRGNDSAVSLEASDAGGVFERQRGKGGLFYGCLMRERWLSPWS